MPQEFQMDVFVSKTLVSLALHPPGMVIGSDVVLDCLAYEVNGAIFAAGASRRLWCLPEWMVMCGYSPATVVATKSKHEAVGRFYLSAPKVEAKSHGELPDLRDSRKAPTEKASAVAFIAMLSDQTSRHPSFDGVTLLSYTPNPGFRRIGDVIPEGWHSTQRRVKWSPCSSLSHDPTPDRVLTTSSMA